MVILTLVMTEHCNLQCTYCYERQKSDKTVMSFELAQKEIREAFQRPGFDELHVNFFGGEPLVAFSRMKEYANGFGATTGPIPYMMFAGTNGTLVHGKIKEWFDTHKKRFILSVSLDGTREMHNRNRSNSYDEIDFEFFKNSWPLQTCKMTFSPDTIDSAAEGVRGSGRGVRV
jgi:sulfatase maturation enzyme AslB (radical SAM superfamily)